jgi:hypothetical protein
MTKAAELAKMGEILSNSQIGRKNIIINGGMQVAQRGTSSTGLGGSSGIYPTLDRVKIGVGNTDGRFTMSQSAVTDLEGFSNALKIDCTTADTSVAANEFLILQLPIEGFDAQQLKATSTTTRAFTLSFYAKSNASRAISSEVNFTNGTNRSASKLHTIGTSWARYTFTIPAASSTQVDNDNSHELSINFWLHAGTTYSSGTMSASLESITNANRAAGIGSIFASTDNEIEITGIQLEVGSQATPFEHRSFGEEQRLCQRYAIVYSKNGQPNMGQRAIGTGASTNNSGAYQAFIFPQVTMRAIPTLTVGGSVSDYEILKYETGFVDLNSSISLYSASGRSLFVLAISSATAEAERGRDVIMRLEGDNSSLLFDSEL